MIKKLKIMYIIYFLMKLADKHNHFKFFKNDDKEIAHNSLLQTILTSNDTCDTITVKENIKIKSEETILFLNNERK
jgi:hypothetical protein